MSMSCVRVLLLLVACLVSVAPRAFADPFGISLKKSFTPNPKTWTLVDDTTEHLMYETTKVSKPHPFFQKYQIFLTKNKKPIMLMGLTKVQPGVCPSQSIQAYKDLLAQLTVKYGIPAPLNTLQNWRWTNAKNAKVTAIGAQIIALRCQPAGALNLSHRYELAYITPLMVEWTKRQQEQKEHQKRQGADNL